MLMPGVRDLEVRHLAALRAVVSEGSFGRAAARLGFSQAAISQQIAGLERALGEPVFDRPGGPRPVTLTPAGRLLLEHASAILDRLELADAELEALRAGSAGRLVVGTFQSVSVKLLPTVVGTVRMESPALDIRLFESDSNDELLDRLLDETLDLTFVEGPIRRTDVDTALIAVDPFVAVVPPGTTLNHDGTYPIGRLATDPLIGGQPVRPGPDAAGQPSTCQVRIDEGLHDAGIEPTYVFRSNDNGAVQAMVRAGMGVAVMARLAVDADDPGVRVARLAPDLPPREIHLAWRRGRTRSPAAERFVDVARSACAKADAGLTGSGRRPSRSSWR